MPPGPTHLKERWGDAAGPVGLVLLTMVGLWVAFGVTLADALTYVGYEVGFILLPGWILWRALVPAGGGRLRQLVFGWALGYALELIAFMATAGTGHRGLLALYPLVVAALAGPIALRRRAGARAKSPDPPAPAEGTRQGRHWRWGLAVVASLAVVYVCVPYFQSTRVPPRDTPIGHYSDLDFHLSLAAEAKHHWPMEDPAVAGEQRPYHIFVYMHLASASQITGLDLPIVFFRLYLAPLVVLAVLGLWLTGRTLARKSIVGVIAAGLFIFVGEIDLDPGLHQGAASLIPFGGFSIYTFHGPSASFGLALLMPLLVTLVERLDAAREPGAATPLPPWPLVLLLIFACSDAKITVLPTLIGGLAIYVAWRLWRDRELDRTALIAAGLSAVTLGILYAIQYRGYPSPIRVDPFAYLTGAPVLAPTVNDISSRLGGWDPLGEGLASVVTLTFLVGPLLVGVGYLLRRGVRWPLSRVFLLAVAGSGLIQGIVLNDRSGPNVYYSVFYGLAALAPVSAEGLREGWIANRVAIRAALQRLLPLAAVALAVIAALTWVPERSGELLSSKSLLFALRYGGVALALLGVWLVARAVTTRTAATGLIVALLILLGAYGGPFDYFRSTPFTPHDPDRFGKALDRGEIAGLEWVRDHTSDDAVIAVNDYSLVNGPGIERAFYMGYSAYAERRTFIEGWQYSTRWIDAVVDGGTGRHVFDARLALNRAAFAGDPRALREMYRHFGVRYIVLDKRFNDLRGSPRVYDWTAIKFTNPSMDVLEIRPELLERSAGKGPAV